MEMSSFPINLGGHSLKVGRTEFMSCNWTFTALEIQIRTWLNVWPWPIRGFTLLLLSSRVL